MGSTSDPPFFYMYQCFFRDLGVCLPFTQFECDFLNFVNSDPCQLHPNSWGFFRAFQVLCSTLGIGLSLPVFLHFYRLKLGIPPYGWASLSGSKAGRLFSLYSQSYKNFKQEFFRVGLKDVDPLKDEVFHFGGLPKFPFNWRQAPARFNGLGNLQLTASFVVRSAARSVSCLARIFYRSTVCCCRICSTCSISLLNVASLSILVV
uniref:Transposase (putative) gypsy type domain-containing protein n=1 Tax=Cajanus cajan TaxID=3821 RepID=A0A151TE80_CAJCA|nr:hypothetical protein KK1_011585 [Cajanus cajan]